MQSIGWKKGVSLNFVTSLGREVLEGGGAKLVGFQERGDLA